jgi:hypothetical protein
VVGLAEGGFGLGVTACGVIITLGGDPLTRREAACALSAAA